jgi:hypothetical protein
MGGYSILVKREIINEFKLRLGPLSLAAGDYYLYFWLIKPWAENYHTIQQPIKFSVEMSDPYNSGFDFQQAYSRGSFAVPITLVS